MSHSLPFNLPSLHEEDADHNPFLILNPNFNPYTDQPVTKDGSITFEQIIQRSQVNAKTPFTIISHLMSYPSTLHQHDFIEITFVLNGDALMVSNHHPFLLTEESLVITPAGVSHFISPLPQHSKEPLVINLLLKPELLEQLHLPYFDTTLLAGITLSDNPTFIRKEEFYQCRRSLYQVIECYYKEHFCFSYALLGDIIQFLVDLSSIKDEKAQPIDRLSQLVSEQIHEHFRDISLEKLADTLNYSKGYLSRHIKKQTGQTISQLITQERLRNAELALSSTTLSVADIAEKVGYQSLGHFYHIFKETYHVTPVQYRKIIEKSKNER